MSGKKAKKVQRRLDEVEGQVAAILEAMVIAGAAIKGTAEREYRR